MRGKAGRFSRLVFTPDMLSGLTGWWDASDAGTLYDATSGGSLVAADGEVARWEDKTGNGRHFTQTTSNERPVRKTSVINGLDVIRFDGSNDRLNSGTFWPALFSDSASTAFVVAKADTATSDTGNFGDNQTVLGNQNGSYGAFVLKSDDTVSAFGYGTDFSIASLSYTPGAWAYLSAWHDGTNIRASLNGGSAASAALSFVTLTLAFVTVGVGANGTQFFDGDVAEIITYNVALSDSDRASVESYLSSKYGIA